MPRAPLALHECEEIHLGLVEDPTASWASLARRMGRHPTTIAWEFSVSGGRPRRRPGRLPAHRLAAARRAAPRTPPTAAPGGAWALRDRICAKLRLGRSPGAICADLAAHYDLDV